MAILFDIDGTLLDDPAALRAGITALSTHLVGADRTPDELLEMWRVALDRHFQRYLDGEIDFQEHRRARVREVLGNELSDAAADDLFDVYLEAHESAWSLYDDAIACLDALATHRLGIVSNGRGSQQRSKLEQLGIIDRFDCVVISAEVGQRKPEPTIFLTACAALGVAPDETVYVGDQYETDAVGARRAGLTGVWLDRSSQRRSVHEAPVVETLNELVELVSGQHLPNKGIEPTATR